MELVKNLYFPLFHASILFASGENFSDGGGFAFTAPVGWSGTSGAAPAASSTAAATAGARPAAAAPASSAAMPPVTLQANPSLQLAGDGEADKRQRRQLQRHRLQRQRRQAELPEGAGGAREQGLRGGMQKRMRSLQKGQVLLQRGVRESSDLPTDVVFEDL
ncbi:hypothetical protein SASPL_116325 [Salvia splendens]|uniref:Uncharacterized protein n=1 Tax=Salvia splendens TaxID=180675 RepID=A0A8X8XTK7_SALSN|nr:hypothetical protein SASPL_116325 [Salvia splendens]